MSDSSKLLGCLLLGAIIGAAAGILLAPNSGKETIKKIKEESSDLQSKIDEQLQHLNKESLDELKSKIEDIKDKASDKYTSIAEKAKKLEKEMEAKMADLKQQYNNLKSNDPEVIDVEAIEVEDESKVETA